MLNFQEGVDGARDFAKELASKATPEAEKGKSDS